MEYNMISNQILQTTVDGLKEISRVDLCVIDAEGKVVAKTFDNVAECTADALVFIDSPADSQVVNGYQFFKVVEDGNLEYIILAKGTTDDVFMLGKLAAFQIQNLLDYLSKKNPQQACLLALACFSGARISELFRFTTDLIDLNNLAYEDLFIETSEEIKTKGRGKLGKGLYKYILKAPFEPYYVKWLEEREKIMKELGVSHNHLFIKRDGSSATPDTARVWIRNWEKYLTEEEPSNTSHSPVDLYAHAFRHYLCTYLAKIGLEQELVVEIFGWSSSDMFNIYNDMTAKDKKWKGLEKLKRAIEV